MASTNAWSLGSGSYTYDSNKIEIVEGTAQLKAGGGAGSGWLTGWTYRQAITLTRTGAELTNKIVEVTHNLDNFSSVFSNAEADGSDIRFTSDDGTTSIDYFIADYTPSTIASIYVEVPTIAANDDTTIYMYYGNDAVSTTSNMAATFSAAIYVDGMEEVWAYLFPEGFSSGVTYAADDGSDDKAILDSATDFLYGPGETTYDMQERAWVFRAKSTASSGESFKMGAMHWDGGGAPPAIDCADGGLDCISLNLYDGTGGTITSTSGYYETAIYTNTLSGSPDENTWHVYKIVLRSVRNEGQVVLEFYRDGASLGTVNYTEAEGPNVPFGGALPLMPMVSGYGEVDWILGYQSYRTYDGLTMAMGTMAGSYATDNPTIAPATSFEYSLTQDFEAVSSGTVQFQISADGGSTWYWYDSITDNQWEAASGYSQSNSADAIGDNIGTFTVGAGPTRNFLWKAYLHSTGTEQATLTSVTLTYTVDTADPDNPSSVTGKDEAGGSVILGEETWYNYSQPYFSWTAPSDNGGPDTSGIGGYYVYFGTTATADPDQLVGSGSVYTTSSNRTPSLSASGTYYLRIETKDNAGNIKDIAAEDDSLFTYWFDGNVPSNPLVYRSAPSSSIWYRLVGDLTFSWYTSGGNHATDTGGSGLVGTGAGYQYKINDGPWCGQIDGSRVEGGVMPFATTGLTLTEDDAVDFDDGTNGFENTFEIRTVDVAGNYSNDNDVNRTLKTIFKFNGDAPTAVTGLAVDESIKTVNSFTFSWDADSPAAPDGYPTPETYIEYYVYKVGANGTEVTVDIDEHQVGDQIVVEGVQALQNNIETNFYVWAVNESGSPGEETSTVFRVNAPAPNAPTDVEMVDVSNRDSAKYKISINWNEPADKGTGFNGYNIYRSTDGTSFGETPIATNSGENASTSFTDTNLSNTTSYYYKVASVDNTGQESSTPTSAIDQETRLLYIIPTGRYTRPPEITEDVVVTPRAFSSLITWETDREASSFVYIAAKDSLGQCNLYGVSGKGQPEKSTTHSVNVTGLEPSTNYCFKAMWEDSDGNQGLSTTALSFTTKERPTIRDVSADNITLNSATIKWKSTTIDNARVEYCVKDSGVCGVVRSNTGDEQQIIQLSNLEHTSTYIYTIYGTDIDGGNVVSDTYSFDTLKKPIISNFRFETVDEAAVSTLHATWETNVPTTSILNYQASGGSSANKSDPEYKKVHDITIGGLADKTTYFLTARGVDEHGNEAVSETNNFTTPDDTRPPKLSNLTVEIKASGISSSQKAQLVVSWETDEPASSQVEFGPGISSDSYTSKSQEDSTLTMSHIVIVSELDPAKLYHLRAVSKDASGNIGRSLDTTAITGKVQRSVIDLILNSLERSLSFLTKLPFLNQ